MKKIADNNVDVKQLMQHISGLIDSEKREKEESKQREAASRARQRIHESEAVREEKRQQLKQSLPEGSKVAFRVDNPALLRGIVNSIVSIAGDTDDDEVPLVFTAEGLSFRLMDPSHVSLLEIAVPSSSFYNYIYEGPASTKIGLRASDLRNVLKLTELRDSLTFVVQGDSLLASIEGETTRSHKLSLIETYHGDVPVPKLDFAVRATVDKYALSKLLRECQTAGEDQVTVVAGPKGLAFKGRASSGDFTSQVDWPYPSESVKDLLCEDGQQKATYSVDYLVGIVKAAVSDLVSLEMSSKKPLRLTFPLAGPTEGASMTYWLAPRVNDGEVATSPPAPQSPPKTPEPAAEPSPEQTPGRNASSGDSKPESKTSIKRPRKSKKAS